MTAREGDHGALERGEASGMDTKGKVEEVKELCPVRESKQNLRATMMRSKAAIDKRLVEWWGWEEPGKSIARAGVLPRPASLAALPFALPSI